MNEAQANKKAQAWWGKRGKALFETRHSALGTPIGSRYVVGETELPANLGGRIAYVAGESTISFEAAFAAAENNGYGPEKVVEEMEDDELY